MVDASVTISAEDFKRELDFVKGLIVDLGIDQKVSRCSLLTYGSKASIEFGLQSFSNKQDEVVSAISKAKQLEGSGGTESALRRILELFEKHDNKGSPVVGYIFMHEKSTNIEATIEQAQVVRSKGIILFGVAIGRDVDEKMLTSIVTGPELIIRAESFQSIERSRTIVETKTRQQVESWTSKVSANTMNVNFTHTHIQRRYNAHRLSSCVEIVGEIEIPNLYSAMSRETNQWSA